MRTTTTTNGYGMLVVALAVLFVARESQSFAPPHHQKQLHRAAAAQRPPPSATTVEPLLLLGAAQQHPNPNQGRNTRLYFFGRDNNDAKNEAKQGDDDSDDDKKEKEEKPTSFFGSLFNRGGDDKPKEIAASGKEDETSTTTSPSTTATAVQDPPSSSSKSSTSNPPPKASVLTPSEQAAKLRGDAERMRLEAERMDAELTLRKIARLEKELTAAKASSTTSTTTTTTSSSSSEAANNSTSSGSSKRPASSSGKKDVEQLQREISALLNKVQGGSSSSSSSATTTASTNGATHKSGTTKEATKPTTTETTDSGGATASSTVDHQQQEGYNAVWPDYVKPFDQKGYDEIYDGVKDLPKFLLATMAVGMELKASVDPETGKAARAVNATELATAIDQLKRQDFSFSSKPPPQFSWAQISQMERRIRTYEQENKEKKSQKNEQKSWFGGGSDLFDGDDPFSVSFGEFLDSDDPRVQELKEQDPRRFAQLVLELEYYSALNVDEEDAVESIMALAGDSPFLKGFMDGAGIVNGTLPKQIDTVIQGIYPKCTTKQDFDEPVEMPTEAQVNQLIAEVLPKAGFQASAKPEEVLGGFIVRGVTKVESGDEFIDKLDKAMERSNLKDKMTVLYQADFSALGLDDDDFNPFEADSPILYVVGPKICREPRPVQLSIVSGLGLATSWYLSIFPFLLNPTLAARVDEQLALADASMTPDLEFLTDLSIPLFATFLGIQLLHELAHLVVAGTNGVSVSYLLES